MKTYTIALSLALWACSPSPAESRPEFSPAPEQNCEPQSEPTPPAPAPQACACPVPDAGPQPHQSGTRLQARTMVGEDGSRVFLHLYDTQTETVCKYRWVTGQTNHRCLPAEYGPLLQTSDQFYRDSACTERLVQTDKPWLVFENNTWYKVGPDLTGIPLYFKGNSCYLSGQAELGKVYHALESEHDISEFVIGTEQ